MSTPDPIKFYSTKGPLGCFSNFSAHPIDLDGRRWPTTEHYFQAMKFDAPARRESIRTAASPTVAARLGRSRSHPIRRDWEAVKDGVMRRAVRAKVDQHADVRAALLATGDAPLVEDAPKDYYWGCGKDGTGKNMLGAILMEVRADLRKGAD